LCHTPLWAKTTIKWMKNVRLKKKSILLPQYALFLVFNLTLILSCNNMEAFCVWNFQITWKNTREKRIFKQLTTKSTLALNPTNRYEFFLSTFNIISCLTEQLIQQTFFHSFWKIIIGKCKFERYKKNSLYFIPMSTI
jgi:hypothetical protein